MRKSSKNRGGSQYSNEILKYAYKKHMSPQKAIVVMKEKRENELKRIANDLGAVYIGGYKPGRTMAEWRSMKDRAQELGLECDIRSYSSVKNALKSYSKQQAELKKAEEEKLQEEVKGTDEPKKLKGAEKQYIDNLLAVARNIDFRIHYNPEEMTPEELRMAIVKRYNVLNQKLPKILKTERIIDGKAAQAIIAKVQEEKKVEAQPKKDDLPEM